MGDAKFYILGVPGDETANAICKQVHARGVESAILTPGEFNEQRDKITQGIIPLALHPTMMNYSLVDLYAITRRMGITLIPVGSLELWLQMIPEELSDWAQDAPVNVDDEQMWNSIFPPVQKSIDDIPSTEASIFFEGIEIHRSQPDLNNPRVDLSQDEMNVVTESPSEPIPPTNTEKKKLLIIFSLLIALVLVWGGTSSFYYYLLNNKKSPNVVDSTPNKLAPQKPTLPTENTKKPAEEKNVASPAADNCKPKIINNSETQAADSSLEVADEVPFIQESEFINLDSEDETQDN